MSGETHTAAGMLVGAMVGAAMGGDEWAVLGGALAGSAAGKLPDILEGRIFEHRKMTHSLLWVTGLYVFVMFTSAALDLPRYILLAAWSSYMSHLVLDAMTISGIYWLHPLSRRKLHLLPRGLRPKTSGSIDNLIGASAGVGLLWVGWQHLPPGAATHIVDLIDSGNSVLHTLLNSDYWG